MYIVHVLSWFVLIWYQCISCVSTEAETLSFWWNFNHWLHQKLSFWQLSVQPVIKFLFDEILITDCTESCHFDNFRCSQWWRFRQNDDISVSVSFITHWHVGSCPNVEFAPYIVSDKHVTAMQKRYMNRYKPTLWWCFMKEQLLDASLNDVKHNYTLSNDRMPSTEWMFVLYHILSILHLIILSYSFAASLIYSYGEFFSLLSIYCCFYVWFIMWKCIFVSFALWHGTVGEQFNWMVYTLWIYLKWK